MVSVPEDPDDTAEAVQGQYDLWLPTLPSYCQQLLDNIMGIRSGVWVAQRHLVAMKEDQWLLGTWQLESEEIWMKMEFRVWSQEKGVEEMDKLPKLKQTELKKIQYKKGSWRNRENRSWVQKGRKSLKWSQQKQRGRDSKIVINVTE